MLTDWYTRYRIGCFGRKNGSDISLESLIANKHKSWYKVNFWERTKDSIFKRNPKYKDYHKYPNGIDAMCVSICAALGSGIAVVDFKLNDETFPHPFENNNCYCEPIENGNEPRNDYCPNIIEWIFQSLEEKSCDEDSTIIRISSMCPIGFAGTFQVNKRSDNCKMVCSEGCFRLHGRSYCHAATQKCCLGCQNLNNDPGDFHPQTSQYEGERCVGTGVGMCTTDILEPPPDSKLVKMRASIHIYRAWAIKEPGQIKIINYSHDWKTNGGSQSPHGDFYVSFWRGSAGAYYSIDGEFEFNDKWTLVGKVLIKYSETTELDYPYRKYSLISPPDPLIFVKQNDFVGIHFPSSGNSGQFQKDQDWASSVTGEFNLWINYGHTAITVA